MKLMATSWSVLDFSLEILTIERLSLTTPLPVEQQVWLITNFFLYFLYIHSPIDTNDYTSRSGVVIVSEDALIQCVSIPIRSDGFSERQRCFSFGITATHSVSGLTVSPGQAEICITDISCK